MGGNFVRWNSGPNQRGTSDIVWSCVFVVFLSTWTTLHINVPPVRKSFWWRFRNKFLLMGVGLLAPEYIACIAFTELRTALVVRSHMQSGGYPEWKLAHSFFVAMGGYMACLNGEYKPISAENFVKWQQSGIITITRPSGLRTGRSHSESMDSASMQMQTIHKDSSTPRLMRARPLDSLAASIELPWISKEGMAALSKADVLLKSIACTQIAWLLVQYIARAAQSLPSSSLEALTVAYVVCALFSYAAWWKKPYDLEAPISVVVSTDHEISYALDRAPEQIPFNDDPDLPVLHTTILTYVLPCMAAVLSFSCLHFLAWHDYFNTVTEKWLWRSCSIMFVWFHVVFMCFGVYMEMHMKSAPTAANIAKIGNSAEWKVIWYLFRAIRFFYCRDSAKLEQIDDALLKHCDKDYTPPGPMIAFLVSHTFLYFAARFYVLAEALASLRRAPAGLYDTVDWSKFIPHVH